MIKLQLWFISTITVTICLYFVQAISIFLDVVLRALGSDRGSYYESDAEYVPARLPLLRNQVQHASYIVDHHLAIRNEKGHYLLP